VAGLQELLRECLNVAPGLAEASYLETRVGLRPTSVDDRPVVGRVPSWNNAWVATGHGANGLLQGPFGARVVAHEMTDTALAVDEPVLPRSCLPDRFGRGR
jgi:D-amino-acid dehydrogenase